VRWVVRWDDDAVGDLLSIATSNRGDARRIRQRIIALALTGEGDVKKLKDRDNEWRLRAGDWRVFFTYRYFVDLGKSGERRAPPVARTA
jgi:hypothetical protein